MSGLYIHIPFCERKCAYCTFYSLSKPWKNESAFFQALEKELDGLPADFAPETIFIGGGTPTAPDFQTLGKYFPMFGKFKPVEFSVEVNPGTVDEAKLSLLRKSGVNRLSIGIQSFDFQCLETLGRIHSGDEAEAAFRLARAAGFDNISIDLMFGIPGQTMAMLDADLDRALDLGPEHIAIYNLMYEEGTPLAKRTERSPVLSQSPRIVGQGCHSHGSLPRSFGASLPPVASLYSESLSVSHSQANTRSRIREACPTIEKKQFAGDRQLARLDEELERDMYDRIRTRLKGAGFVHYEISNFAKPGFECRHNLLYWTGGEYLGCGPAAHSHWNGTRWANVADLDDYCSNITQPTPPFRHPSHGGDYNSRIGIPLPGGVPERRGGSEWPRREFEETLDPDAKARETLVMGLRLLKGVEVSPGLFEKQQCCFQRLESQGLLKIDGRHVRLSDEALFVSDSVFSELV